MSDLRIQQQARGMRIIHGAEAHRRRVIVGDLARQARTAGFDEIVLPSVEPAGLYSDKAGPEVLGQMYTFQDRGDRTLCLRPEGTATCQALARELWSQQRDVKLFYEARCYRYERPQAGRYREFLQFGVEWLWPSADPMQELLALAESMVRGVCRDRVEVHTSVKRGLAYYTGPGFEIARPALGAQKQVCGGGVYAEGCGFALGVDRLLQEVDDG